jgi:hypothetical protein
MTWHTDIVGWFLTGWFSPPGWLSDLHGIHRRSEFSSTLTLTSKFSATKTMAPSSTLLELD